MRVALIQQEVTAWIANCHQFQTLILISALLNFVSSSSTSRQGSQYSLPDRLRAYRHSTAALEFHSSTAEPSHRTRGRGAFEFDGNKHFQPWAAPIFGLDFKQCKHRPIQQRRRGPTNLEVLVLHVFLLRPRSLHRVCPSAPELISFSLPYLNSVRWIHHRSTTMLPVTTVSSTFHITYQMRLGFELPTH